MGESKIVREGKVFALFAYLGLLCFIPLLFNKENKFSLFHAKQGLVLVIVELGIFVLTFMPFLGWVMAPILSIIVGIICIVGIVQVLMGNYWKIPIVGEYAHKIKL